MITRDDALFLDFDGTLAPLQDDADAVQMRGEERELILKVAEQLDGAVCLISGRDVDDLAVRAPEGVRLIGNHGLRRRGFGDDGEAGSVPRALMAKLEALAGPGVRIEPKGRVVAVHYRQAPKRGEELVSRLQSLVADNPDYRIEHGKYVIEAKPTAASKGRALCEAMAAPPFHGRRPVMFGDDTTDEAGFSAAQGLGGLGIKVGPGQTVAKARLDAPADVFARLKTLL